MLSCRHERQRHHPFSARPTPRAHRSLPGKAERRPSISRHGLRPSRSAAGRRTGHPAARRRRTALFPAWSGRGHTKSHAVRPLPRPRPPGPPRRRRVRQGDHDGGQPAAGTAAADRSSADTFSRPTTTSSSSTRAATSSSSRRRGSPVRPPGRQQRVGDSPGLRGLHRRDLRSRLLPVHLRRDPAQRLHLHRWRSPSVDLADGDGALPRRRHVQMAQRDLLLDIDGRPGGPVLPRNQRDRRLHGDRAMTALVRCGRCREIVDNPATMKPGKGEGDPLICADCDARPGAQADPKEVAQGRGRRTGAFRGAAAR